MIIELCVTYFDTIIDLLCLIGWISKYRSNVCQDGRSGNKTKATCIHFAAIEKYLVHMNNSTQTIYSYLLFLINNVVWLKETRHEKKMSTGNWFLKVEMFMCNLASFLSYGAHILECIWSSAFWLYVGPWMKNCIMRILLAVRSALNLSMGW